MAVPTVTELRAKSDKELIDLHDQEAPRIQVGVEYYLNELSRREQARQTDTMVKYTRWITWMTFVVTVATALQLAIALCKS